MKKKDLSVENFVAFGISESTKEKICGNGGQGEILLSPDQKLDRHLLDKYRLYLNSYIALQEANIGAATSNWEAVIGVDGDVRISITQQAFKDLQKVATFKRDWPRFFM